MPVVAGGHAEAMTAAIGAALGEEPLARELDRFPDGEVKVRLGGDVRDEAVYVVQSTSPPVQEHLLELLLLADAAHRAGAARITAVVPYLAYARQDRRTAPGEPVALRVVADLLTASHVDRLVVVDPHTPELEAIFDIDVEMVSAIPWLADAIARHLDGAAVVVAPDLGAVKLAERYAARLELPVAVVRKTRLSGEEVETSGVVGEVAGQLPVIVDDMISTGGTIEAALDALTAAGARDGAVVAATHGLLVDPAGDRLGGRIGTLLVSDSVEPAVTGLPIETVALAPLLAETIRRLERGRPLDGLALYR